VSLRLGERVTYQGRAYVVAACLAPRIRDGRIVIERGRRVLSVRPSQLDGARAGKDEPAEPDDTIDGSSSEASDAGSSDSSSYESASSASSEEVEGKPKKASDEKRKRQQKKGEDSVPKKNKSQSRNLLASREARRAYRDARNAILAPVEHAISVLETHAPHMTPEETAKAVRKVIDPHKTRGVLEGGGKQAMRTLRKAGLSEDEIEEAVGMAAGKPEIDTSMVFPYKPSGAKRREYGT
jgi:hypothetical protein